VEPSRQSALALGALAAACVALAGCDGSTTKARQRSKPAAVVVVHCAHRVSTNGDCSFAEGVYKAFHSVLVHKHSIPTTLTVMENKLACSESADATSRCESVHHPVWVDFRALTLVARRLILVPREPSHGG
jgi:hypothetical protein